jgi:hypothetical protein
LPTLEKNTTSIMVVFQLNSFGNDELQGLRAARISSMRQDPLQEELFVVLVIDGTENRIRSTSDTSSAESVTGS